MDERDHRLLSALSDNAWLTYVELGAIANLSASAAQRRVERLIEQGAIVGAHASISPKALGRPLRLYVLVELRDESRTTISAFAKRLMSDPEIIEAHYLAGSADILIAMQTSDMNRYADFAEKHLNANPAVRRYKTLTSMRRLK